MRSAGQPSQCSCSRFNMWPPSLNKPPKQTHSCCSRSNWRAQDAHQNTPKPPQQAISVGGGGALSGGDVVSKGEPGRPDVLTRLWQSPAHVSSISFVPGNDTQFNVWGYQRSNGGRIYSVEGACVLGGMQKLCVYSQCVRLWSMLSCHCCGKGQHGTSWGQG